MGIFRRAQLPGSSGAEVPRTPSGMPLDMAGQHWGNDHWLPSPQEQPSQYAGRFTGRPVIPYARAFAGVQRRNGVAELDPGWTVPAIPGSFAPYWQMAARLNTPPWILNGATAHPQQGPYQVSQLRQAQLQPNLAASGMAAALFAQSASKG